MYGNHCITYNKNMHAKNNMEAKKYGGKINCEVETHLNRISLEKDLLNIS